MVSYLSWLFDIRHWKFKYLLFRYLFGLDFEAGSLDPWRDSTGHRSRERRHCCVGGRVNRHRVPLTGGGELVKVASECISVRLYPCFFYVFQYKFSGYKKISYMTSFFRLFSKVVRYSFTVLLTECPMDTFWCRRVTRVIYINCFLCTHTYTHTHTQRGEF